ncbi:hypothetical protein [Thermosulfurimonas dismutans]|uniref:Uncharacterized protein n=1 Tax=Thermosulfurimonas dismutans TaxID=999894 RepID=A0A179D4Q9_9BACT|nr:hypothetical protein [Thermosulfurimonas dismutans]OAQ21026.1 hypothetical protein TDIS_0952 [Thermosulfurimonas dismutans]
MRKETKRLLKQAYKAAIRASEEMGENFLNPWFFLGYMEFSGLKDLSGDEVFRIMRWLWTWDKNRNSKFFA